MFAVQPSDINNGKSGLLHLTGQFYCKQVDHQKAKVELETKFLGTILLIDTAIIITQSAQMNEIVVKIVLFFIMQRLVMHLTDVPKFVGSNPAGTGLEWQKTLCHEPESL